MKEMKAAVAVTSIQCVDTALSDCEQMWIGWSVFWAGVGKIAEQREIGVFILVREVMHLDAFDQFVNLRLIEKDRRYDDERRRVLGDSVHGIHPRQQARWKEMCEIPVKNC